MQINWPAKIECNRHKSGTDTPRGIEHCMGCIVEQARNSAIDDCKKAYEQAPKPAKPHEYSTSSTFVEGKLLKRSYPNYVGTKQPPSYEDIMNLLSHIPSTKIPIGMINNRHYYYMCKEDIAHTVRSFLEEWYGR